MQPAKYTFGTRGLDLLADVQASFESQGFTTSVSVENFKGHDLHTLAVIGPKRTPVKFTPSS